MRETLDSTPGEKTESSVFHISCGVAWKPVPSPRHSAIMPADFVTFLCAWKCRSGRALQPFGVLLQLPFESLHVPGNRLKLPFRCHACFRDSVSRPIHSSHCSARFGRHRIPIAVPFHVFLPRDSVYLAFSPSPPCCWALSSTARGRSAFLDANRLAAP